MRPRWIWGRGDTVLLPTILQAVDAGQWRFFSPRYKSSTCHVRRERTASPWHMQIPSGCMMLWLRSRLSTPCLLRCARCDEGDIRSRLLGAEAGLSSSTCRNVAEGTRLAALKGEPGNVYFITDGEHVDFEAFVGDMVETHVSAWAAHELP